MRFAGVMCALALMSALAACANANETPPAFANCADAAAYYNARAGERPQEPVPFAPHRVLPPGSSYTMDYNPRRLNVFTDAEGRITEARCG